MSWSSMRIPLILIDATKYKLPTLKIICFHHWKQFSRYWLMLCCKHVLTDLRNKSYPRMELNRSTHKSEIANSTFFHLHSKQDFPHFCGFCCPLQNRMTIVFFRSSKIPFTRLEHMVDLCFATQLACIYGKFLYFGDLSFRGKKKHRVK
jgi:hypothetical protein